ncbi:MAG: DMT family transporter [Candidatus Rokuibacteriota bacterium]
MSHSALGLVLLAAAIHATWNLLTKRAVDKLLFIWWTGIVGTLALLPPVYWLSPPPRWDVDFWARVALGAVLRAAYFVTLSAAYSRGDLSVVYPLARGVAPMVVPAAGVLLLGEQITGVAMIGIAIVTAGVYVMHVPRLEWRVLLAPLRALNSGAVGYAAMTGAVVASYSVVDKWTMSTGVPPAWYAYFTIPVAALLLTPFARRRSRLAAEWSENPGPVVAVSVLMTGGYLLVLYALRLAPVSYVAPAREVAIVFGAILGVLVLGEPHGRQRILGALLIVIGVVLLSQSPAP